MEDGARFRVRAPARRGACSAAQQSMRCRQHDPPVQGPPNANARPIEHGEQVRTILEHAAGRGAGRQGRGRRKLLATRAHKKRTRAAADAVAAGGVLAAHQVADRRVGREAAGDADHQVERHLRVLCLHMIHDGGGSELLWRGVDGGDDDARAEDRARCRDGARGGGGDNVLLPFLSLPFRIPDRLTFSARPKKRMKSEVPAGGDMMAWERRWCGDRGGGGAGEVR